jgi:hypothetical protein
MPEKEIIKILDTEGKERLRIKLGIEKGKVKDLMLQYESYILGKWRNIVRYDITHGFFHRDFLLPTGKEKTRIDINNLNDASIFAEQDLKDKWEFYKSKYLKDLKFKKDDKERNNNK